MDDLFFEGHEARYCITEVGSHDRARPTTLRSTIGSLESGCEGVLMSCATLHVAELITKTFAPPKLPFIDSSLIEQELLCADYRPVF
jgi:hypothetical protein